MDPKRMGEFIAALRKSQGLTQQEVAERLNISNKTVSKWERGDGYPEVSLIPAIAELFGVTTDEIFRGERIPEHKTDLEKNPASVEKQKERLINSSIFKFKNYSLVVLAVIMVSLVLLYGITYSGYGPVRAVSVAYILTAIAVVFQLIMANNLTGSVRAGDIFADDDPRIIKAYRTLYHYNSLVFVSAVTLVVLAVPLILSSGLKGISIGPAHISIVGASFGSYLRFVPICLLVSNTICYVGLRIIKPALRFGHLIFASSNQFRPLRIVSRRLMWVVLGMLVITAAIQALLYWQAASPGKIIFTDRAEFEAFIRNYEQYHLQKAQREQNGVDLELQRELNTTDQGHDDSYSWSEVYSALPNEYYENVDEWDTEQMVVFRKYADSARVRTFISGSFAFFVYIYLFELTMLSFLLLTKELLW